MFLIAKYSYIITFIVRLYIKNNLAGQIREVKRLLLLIPIDLIVENALVMGYIYSE